MERPIRIIHCGTGIAGQQALATILERPVFELVGLLVHSEANDRRDAASFIGQPDCGVHATRDKAHLADLDADIVSYMMLVPDVEFICRLLASGKDVITTGGLMYPAWNNPEAARLLRDACEAGQSSFFVTGINPGFVDEILPLTLSLLSRDWKQVCISEYADCSKYPNQGVIEIMGFGFTQEDIDAGKVADMQTMVDFFEASVAALAHGLGVELDEVRCTREFALTTKPVQLAFGQVEPGTVAGQRWRWAGIKNGEERIVQETYWIIAFDLGEGWPRSGDMEGDTRWQVIIEGTPSMRVIFEPRESFSKIPAKTGAFNPSAVATAMAAINNVPAVLAARPGLLTAIDLIQPRIRM
jgi:hypothetical protein